MDRMPSPIKPLGDTLVLVFDQGRPVEAEELGQLFSSLARDYRQFTGGRTLVIERLETGSLIAYLRDAVEAVRPYLSGMEEWAKAGKALLDFATALTGLLTRAKKDPEGARLFGKGKKRIGTRSVEALLQIATDSGSEVTLRHFTSGGDKLEIHVTPMEALKVREAAEAKRLTKETNSPAPLTAPGQRSLVLPDFSSTSFATALAQFPGSDDDLASPDLRLVITSMIRLLRKHKLDFMVEGVASDLDSQGRHNLAFIVREEAARR